MIKLRDVITIKIPFPSLNSGLAVKAHMYICERCHQHDYCLIKCQSFKNNYYKLHNFIIEPPDENRNPFLHTSLIDCDKRFSLKNVTISEKTLTGKRRNISKELFFDIENKIDEKKCVNKDINREQLNLLNSKVTLYEPF